MPDHVCCNTIYYIYIYYIFLHATCILTLVWHILLLLLS
jgi:hypothetical protein